MKKITNLILILCIILTLCSCGKKDQTRDVESDTIPAVIIETDKKNLADTAPEEITADKTEDKQSDDSSDTSDAPAEDKGSDRSSSMEIDDGGADKLVDILCDISSSYYVGTAGSSLSAAKLAGRLLDWYEDSGYDETYIISEAEKYASAMDADHAAMFNEQLDGVYGMAGYICGTDGEGMLESAGYSSDHYPWDTARMEKLFSAIYAGTGCTYDAVDPNDSGSTP